MFENGEDDDPKGEERMIQKMRKALKKVPNASHAHQELQKSFFKQPIVYLLHLPCFISVGEMPFCDGA